MEVRRSRYVVEKTGRDGEIRTRDPLNPIQVRYQTALRPDQESVYDIRLQLGRNPMNRLHLTRFFLLPGFLLGVLSWANTSAVIQQERDPDFSFEVSDPAFGPGQGPLVCIDEGHNNVHTATGRYRPFANLLRKDGYRVEAFSSSFSADTLTRCTLLVIANALGQEFSPEIRAFPHPSSFSRGELDSLVSWIRKGGALLLFADHAPAPAAAGDLGALLGVAMFDGYARGPGEFPDLFDRAQGTLADHPISNGRNSKERVEAIATFAGQAFQLSQHFQPLLIFGEGSVAYFDFRHNLPDIPFLEWPRFSASGWSQGASREWDSGRIVVLGEAGMCTAQLRGEKQNPMGMNHPKAGENPQFCLNAVRWLTRVLP